MCALFNGTPAQQSSLATVPKKPGSKQTSSLSIMTNLPFLSLIPKHNILIIGRDMNALKGEDENDKFWWHNSSNRNREYLTDFSFEDRRACLNNKFQKKEEKLWTYTYTNNTKALLDYIPMNKKCMDNALNCEVYSTFEEISSDHRIVTAKICLSLGRNKEQIVKITWYDVSSLIERNISNRYTITVRNKFNTLQE